MKKKQLLIKALPLLAIGLSSCSTYYMIKPAGDLTSVSTRNIDNSANYENLKTYAGISRQDVESAISIAKKGKIKKKNPIIKQINEFKSESLKESVDNVVRSVAGGEFIHNARVYTVFELKNNVFSLETKTYYVMSGDVWGIKSENANVNGFHKGDKVVFTHSKDLKKVIGTKNFDGEIGKQYKGTVIDLKGGFATLQLENETVCDIPYSYLTNLGQ